jgi:anti-sigma regulatory factor (Ser/Thr protein kinase)
MKASASFSITIPARFDALDGMRSALRRWLRASGVGSPEAEELVLAAWEVCANAIEHPVRPSGDGVTLVASATEGRVRMEVQDTGRWRERTARRAHRGLGLRLVTGLMDHVAIVGGAAGTRVVMSAASSPSHPPPGTRGIGVSRSSGGGTSVVMHGELPQPPPTPDLPDPAPSPDPTPSPQPDPPPDPRPGGAPV